MYGYGNSMFLATHGILARTNAAVLPVNTVAPVISGSTSLGSVLSSTTGTWTGTPTITFAYQWYRGATLITGATSSTYTIVVADSAAALTCQVTATNIAGSTSATSNAITAQTFTAPVNTVAPAITGTAQEGQTLTSSTGTWTGNPTPTYSYQWKRNGSNIGSATNSTYTLVTADVGQSIKCTVTATNAISAVNADSNTVTPTSAFDTDAQAFITAASITNPTQQSAINTLVVDLKGYNIWTKFKAIYPFCGSTSSQHKWNLKDPRDLDVAFRLVFSGGGTHSVNGYQPGGINGYADTFFNPLAQSVTKSNFGVSVYSRSNTSGYKVDIGAVESGFPSSYVWLVPRYNSVTDFAGSFDDSNFNGNYLTNTLGLISVVRDSATAQKLYQNGVQKGTRTGFNATIDINKNIYVGARNNLGSPANYSDRQNAFTAIHEAFNSTESANFYTAVQAYQTTLGRSIGTQTVSDADAQAFVTNAGIVDQVEANAVNNLVIGLKADGLWTKMKALYPFVGGTAATHKWNLKDPRDLDAAFRLVFNGGWTHSSTGALPNGTNGYANTFFKPSNSTYTNFNFGFYLRTNSIGVYAEFGFADIAGYAVYDYPNLDGNGYVKYGGADNAYTGGDTRGMYSYNQNSNQLKRFKNGTLTNTFSNTPTNISGTTLNYFVASRNVNGTAAQFSNRQRAFQYIADGLTDTEAANLYTAVQAFQTTLGRQVP